MSVILLKMFHVLMCFVKFWWPNAQVSTESGFYDEERGITQYAHVFVFD